MITICLLSIELDILQYLGHTMYVAWDICSFYGVSGIVVTQVLVSGWAFG